ncbi:hypothetical protein MUY14_26985 [Amycolatopsis sp. FBCC-B4732]|uniref:hypothetical protein n=1 Tax=Amycolatopsis sp. FBCC-B4732 TaxID=3079339 RepID=UPI001FF11640|nr:hypothetical protein [Amycolatopsis sp. FBCC-B4732]UOX85427.1 hypothetical protein MUY14_26985 [Amycolatopsis sp. FBCC-B4732]
MSEQESSPRRRSLRSRVLGVLASVAFGYLAGVGVAAAFGVEDPWTRGIIGIGPMLGAAVAEPLWRRGRGT